MTIATLAQIRLYESCQYHQGEVLRVIAPLTEAQMSLRLVPEQRSLGEIAEHIVRARALWLPKSPGESNAEIEQMANWDEPDDPPRSAAEVVYGLELTWRLMDAYLTRWLADE